MAVDLVVPQPRGEHVDERLRGGPTSRGSPGAVALLQRGTCTFRAKVANAIEAGAERGRRVQRGERGRRELFAGTLGSPQVRIPALAASFALGDELRDGVRTGPTGVSVALSADMIAERRRTRNVIAESRRGRSGNVVVVGAHLDSVQRGPGINDNGSGSAAILEVAEQIARTTPEEQAPFVWWGAEELGLLGSRHYVRTLSALQRAADRAVPERRHGRLAELRPLRLRRRRRPGAIRLGRGRARLHPLSVWGLEYQETGLGGGSDHTSFADAGIPVGGLFTGADGRKSADEAAAFGGRAASPTTRATTVRATRSPT